MSEDQSSKTSAISWLTQTVTLTVPRWGLIAAAVIALVILIN